MQSSRASRSQPASGKSSAKVRLFWCAVGASVMLSLLVITPLAMVWTSTELGEIKRQVQVPLDPERGNASRQNDTNETETVRSGAGLEVPWRGGQATFNWHPLLMIIAFVPVMVQSLLTYRIYSRILCTAVGKTGQKLVHVTLHLVELVLVAVALAAVFDYHHRQGYPHVRSLHSWMGLTTVGMFLAVMVSGGVFYLLPSRLVKSERRRAATPYHRMAGVGVMLMAFASMASGISEALALDGGAAVYPASASARLGQAVGVLLPFVAIPVAFVLSRAEFRRRLDQVEARTLRPNTTTAASASQPASLHGTGAIMMEPTKSRRQPATSEDELGQMNGGDERQPLHRSGHH
eukprot:scpid72542/ scgid34437/ Cytochrome b reductase 1